MNRPAYQIQQIYFGLTADTPTIDSLYKGIGDYLGNFVSQVKAIWKNAIMTGRMPWQPLAASTIAQKEREGVANPTLPLYRTGDLLNRIDRWRVEFEVNKDHISASLVMDQNDDDLCIDQDMFFGSDRVGKNSKIPARPLVIPEADQDDLQEHFEEWLKSQLTDNLPSGMDRSNYDLYFNNRQKWIE